MLSDAEIRLFWRGVVEPPLTRRAGLALQLALLTGVRVGEVAGLCRGELEHLGQPELAAWTIPSPRVKNGRDHMVPLSPMARGLVLELLAMIDSKERYLLPVRSPRRMGHMRSNSLTDGMANFGTQLGGEDEAVKTWRAEPPTPHDLRRTVETRLASMGIPKEIRDAVLNHTTPGVGSKHYNHTTLPQRNCCAHSPFDAVVSGDEKQMPPTSFFASKVENDEGVLFDGASIGRHYHLSAISTGQ